MRGRWLPPGRTSVSGRSPAPRMLTTRPGRTGALRWEPGQFVCACRGACIVVKRRLEAGMPRTSWLLAAAAVLPLLVPPSAVAWELLPLEDRLALESTEISSAKVCGAGECREVSDPEAATALAVGPAPPPGYGHGPPCARAALVQEHAHDPRREARRGGPCLRLRHRGALRRADARGGRGLGDLAQRERRGLRKAHSRAYAPPGEDASGRGRGRAAGRPGRRGRRGPERGTPAPASEGSNVRIVALGGGVLAALWRGCCSGSAPRRVDAASGARGTGVGTVRSSQDVRQGPCAKRGANACRAGRVPGPSARSRSGPRCFRTGSW